MPTGSICSCVPNRYSWGTDSRMSRSLLLVLRFSSHKASIMSCVISIFESKCLTTVLATVCIPMPPMPTYTRLMLFCIFCSIFSFMFRMHCVILLTLLMRPLRIKVVEGSWAKARIWMAPSGCLQPATPVTFDEPSSIATIKLSSVAIILFFIDSLVRERSSVFFSICGSLSYAALCKHHQRDPY